MKNLNIFSLISEYDSAKSEGVLNVPNVSFVDEDSSVRYLLKNIPTHNGYDYVDLGLPSGLKWATYNLGATSPEEYGLYFAWGETTGYTTEQITSGVRSFTEDEYNAGPAASISAGLTLQQDAARVNLGGNWRMPTKDEYQELIDNCNIVWTDNYNGTGVVGSIFTSKVNESSVFFPAAGYYDSSYWMERGADENCWSASLDSSSTAFHLDLFCGNHYVSGGWRYMGLPVRGVFK